jgi:hypothetical protein
MTVATIAFVDELLLVWLQSKKIQLQGLMPSMLSQKFQNALFK